jgi:hypothetical protein
MSRRDFASELPSDVLEQLDKRLVESNFSNYHGIAEWLRSLGFSVGKSSVHRYGVALLERLREEKAVGSPQVELRLRCLQIYASGCGPDGKTPQELIDGARLLTQWVCGSVT